MATSLTPAGPAPPGVTPNFDNPSDTLLPVIIATGAVCITFTTAFVGARLIAKRTVSGFAIDDWLLISTWAIFTGYNAIAIAQGVSGLGRHVWDVRALDAVRVAQLSWAIELIYCILTWLAKAALLLQLQRTFVATKKGAVHITIHILLWSNLAFYFGSFFAILFECTPQARIWDPLLTTGHCIQTFDLLIAMGIINVVSDLAILILPIWAIWHLRMNTKVKLGISAIFATGLLAFAASIARLAYTVQSLWNTDTTYLFAQVALWSLAEIASIILCTCFPLVPRFVQVLRGRHRPATGNRSYASANGAYTATAERTRDHPRTQCRCGTGLACSLHGANDKSEPAYDTDEERLYIHKTISVELVARDAHAL